LVLIIAEAGVNHNGSISNAKELVNAAKKCGADIIKFQSFISEDLVIPSANKATYQIKNTLKDESQFKMLKSLELSFEEQVELKEYCDSKDIEFLSTGFDHKSLNFLNKLGLKRFKIPSGEITNLPYLRLVGSFETPIILSTGMSDINEIKEALIEIYNSGRKCNDLTIMHCTTEYPAPFEDINLNALQTIKNEFKFDVGYSDHSKGIEVSLAAVALGATIIEKHITLDRNMDGPDHEASLEPNEFKNLVDGVKNISVALGSAEKKVSQSEIKNLYVARKSLVAKKRIKKGDLFSNENLCAKRPGNGISPMRWEEIVGMRSKKNFEENDLITI